MDESDPHLPGSDRRLPLSGALGHHVAGLRPPRSAAPVGPGRSVGGGGGGSIRSQTKELHASPKFKLAARVVGLESQVGGLKLTRAQTQERFPISRRN